MYLELNIVPIYYLTYCIVYTCKDYNNISYHVTFDNMNYEILIYLYIFSIYHIDK